MSTTPQSKPVCRYYNSEKGCKSGRYCQFRHLNWREYADYSRSMHFQNPPRQLAKSAYRKSSKYVTNRNYKGALSILSKLVADYPFSEQYQRLITLCSDQLALPETETHFKRLLALNPFNPMHHVNYAVYLLRQNQPDLEAVRKRFQEALRLCDSNESDGMHKLRNGEVAKVHGYAAKFFSETEGDSKKAQSHYRIALDVHELPKCHWHFALLLRKMGKLEEAENHFKRCIQIKTGNPLIPCHLDYIKLLIYQERYQEAEEQYLFCLRLTNDADILFAYGKLLCEFMHKMELGLRYMEGALSSSSNSDYVQIYEHYKEETEVEQMRKQLQSLDVVPEKSIESHDLCKEGHVGSLRDPSAPSTANEVFCDFSLCLASNRFPSPVISRSFVAFCRIWCSTTRMSVINITRGSPSNR